MVWEANYTGSSASGDGQPEYFRDVYGDATIGWVPPVVNYNYPDNFSQRGPSDGIFTWEEVTIELENVQSGALLEFTMPDQYLIQITPDLGWSDKTSMFGDDNDIGSPNPHLKSLGPYSINDGTLTDNGDNSVTVEVVKEDFESSATKGFKKHYWRAVPFADGNPGLGGFPVSFDYISNESQLDFTVDNIVKETSRPIQTITGTKSARSVITIENEDNPTVFVEQFGTAWKVWFSIDRDAVNFRIVATDSGEGVAGYHKVHIEYESFGQYGSHVWNSFDSFGLLASINRLPNETNKSLKERTIDSFSNRGGTHFQGLAYGANRELNLPRIDEALTIERERGSFSTSMESSIDIDVTHTRLSIIAPSFIKEDEVIYVDEYDNILTTLSRINDIIHIKTEKGTIVSEKDWYHIEDESGKLIKMKDHGVYKVTYSFSLDFDYETYPRLSDLVSALNETLSPNDLKIVSASMDSKASGSETCDRLYLGRYTIDIEDTSAIIGWSYASLKSVANEEWKRSFEDSKGLYFSSKFYRYIKELKSQTNVEWGSVVADENVWDAIGKDFGEASLPLVYDIDISDYKIPVTAYNKSNFDPWEAFRMNYYYAGVLIKNVGIDKKLFMSGVGFRTDCFVSLKLENLSSEESSINLNPSIKPVKDSVTLNDDIINTVLFDI